METSGKCIHDLENLYLGERIPQQPPAHEPLERTTSLKPRRKEAEVADHIQFLITQKSGPKTCSTTDQNQIDESDVEITSGEWAVIFIIVFASMDYVMAEHRTSKRWII